MAFCNPVLNEDHHWKKFNTVVLDNRMKDLFLEALFKTGKKSVAARAIGISGETLRLHAKKDDAFSSAIDETLLLRAEMMVDRLENEAMEGFTQPIFDKNGNHVGDRPVKETQLRLAMLKRYDPEYKDRSDINFSGNGVGGVLLVPADMTIDQLLLQGEEIRKKMTIDKADNFKDVTPVEILSD